MFLAITCVDVDARIAFVVAIGEALEHTVNLLRLLWQLNLHKQLAYRHVDWVTEKGKLPHVAAQDGKKKGVVGLAEVAGHNTLVKVIRLDPFEVPAGRLALLALWQYKGFSADVH